MLEKMSDFFNRRLEGYEEHQLNEIEGAKEFYPYTADLLSKNRGARVLDLGCGTGLELDYYFALNSEAHITGIDLAEDMLSALKKKFDGKNVITIQGSYFDVPFESNQYDTVVSVESLHHFTMEKKVALYRKVWRALVTGGYFILTDYFAMAEEEEAYLMYEFNRLKKEQGICDNEFYHFDTPLTIDHEIQALKETGFSSVELLKEWGATCTIKAMK